MCARHMHKVWISALGAMAALCGCATSQQELLPTRPGVSMSAIWHQATGGAGAPGLSAGQAGERITRLQQARSALRRPLPGAADLRAVRAAYTRTAANEIYSQFPRLPNPDLMLYIFPHLSGGSGEQVPIPGYTTVFPLYTRAQYAKPGERAVYGSTDGTRRPTR